MVHDQHCVAVARVDSEAGLNDLLGFSRREGWPYSDPP
jgi:hypothetical protein